MLDTRDHRKGHIIQLLGNMRLFSSLSSMELQQIGRKIKIKSLRKGEVVLNEEDTNEYMYIILTGKVKVVRTTRGGKEIILAMHRSGESFGELSLIDTKTVPAVVLAAEHSTVAIIARKDFYSMISAHRKVLDSLLQILCSRLRDSWGRIQLLSFNNASQRIRMLLVQMANECGRGTAEGTLLNTRLTHQDIADMTGVARETATRILDKLHRDGVIKVVKGKITLLEHDLLEGEFPV
jgi:CRP/FNR family transcriptional regulator, cyclic AMP receptor protein